MTMGSGAGDSRMGWSTPTSGIDGWDPSAFLLDIASHHCSMSVQSHSKVELVSGRDRRGYWAWDGRGAVLRGLCYTLL